ncbi:uncharacterized protein A4U43_C04F15200 [Asparagus officinalis]|uniref:Lipoyl-binding domain-containing protein n=1 Tax=Asparagus officinalis TaxID=4686 RepID=A0A5P1F2U3_ASPOF|nr:uncharacterized protein A4U43_C04F15200 [Asparagus officinalis]
MASNLARLVRRPAATYFLLRSYRHVKNFSHIPGAKIPINSKPRREFIKFFQKDSPYHAWSRSFSSDNGDIFDAVVPFMGESITDGTLSTFLKKPGDRVEVDEPIAQVETDKVTIDVASPEAGIIEKFVANEGDTVMPGTKVAVISKSASAVTHVAPSEEPDKSAAQPSPPAVKETDKSKAKVEDAAKEKPKEPSAVPTRASASVIYC